MITYVFKDGTHHAFYVHERESGYLGLRFAKKKVGLEIVKARTMSGLETKRLNEELIRQSVLVGLEEATQRLRTPFYVKQVFYCESDDAAYSLYRYLTLFIAEKALLCPIYPENDDTRYFQKDRY